MISESRLLLLDHESPGVVEASPPAIEGPLSTHQQGTGIPQDIHHKPPSSSHLQETSPLFPHWQPTLHPMMMVGADFSG